MRYPCTHRLCTTNVRPRLSLKSKSVFFHHLAHPRETHSKVPKTITQKPPRPSPRGPNYHHSEAPKTIPSTRDDTPADSFGCEILPPPPFPAPPGAPMLSRCVNVRFLNSPLPPAPSLGADPPPLPPWGFSAFLASMRVFFACRHRGASLIRNCPPP